MKDNGCTCLPKLQNFFFYWNKRLLQNSGKECPILILLLLAFGSVYRWEEIRGGIQKWDIWMDPPFIFACVTNMLCLFSTEPKPSWLPFPIATQPRYWSNYRYVFAWIWCVVLNFNVLLIGYTLACLYPIVDFSSSHSQLEELTLLR